MPFRTRPDQPRDLLALVENEVRERIEEAVDYVSLEAMVQSRRARGRPAPAADNARDREEFHARATAFLTRLAAALGERLDPAARRKVDEAAARGGGEPQARLIAAQVALARTLPDYWQRFDAVRTAYLDQESASGGHERGGFLDRLFRR